MSIAHKLRVRLRTAGVDVARWPQSDPAYGLHRAMFTDEPEVLLDVGANDGGFVRSCRAFGYQGLVYSFEPSSTAFARLRQAAQDDPLWHVQQLGLGDQDAEAVLNIAGNQEASSSLLPMLDEHRSAAPESAYVGDEQIQVSRLDTWITEQVQPWQRIALKLDVQGFERQVLTGAEETLPLVTALRIELSTQHLYDGDWLWEEAAAWLSERGFSLAGVAPGFSDPRSGRMLQFDAVFVR